MTLASLIVVNLLGLVPSESGPGLPPGWKVRSVRGVERPVAEILVDGTEPVFRLSSAGQAAWFYRPIAPPLSAGGRLRWSWRIEAAPPGAALGVRALDDSPLRVYVVFGKLGGLLNRSGRVIFYSVRGTDTVGYAAPSLVSSRLYVIGVDGPETAGTWQEHEVDPVADYRRIWGGRPGRITAVGVMQDTDQTGGRAVADLRMLKWEAGQ